MPSISAEQQTEQAGPSVWWPKFDNLYEALREARVSDAPNAFQHLDALLTQSQSWLAHGLLGFLPASPAAKAQLKAQRSIQAPNQKQLPIAASLIRAALQLSSQLVSMPR